MPGYLLDQHNIEGMHLAVVGHGLASDGLGHLCVRIFPQSHINLDVVDWLLWS